MRPVDKDTAPKTYTKYEHARHDLAARIGYYCSYCEMKLYQGIEVEHILPQNQGGEVVDWDNFLLSCKYCNTIKSDHNTTLNGYFWPDRDNTDLAFEYSEADVIKPKTSLNSELNTIAKATINLMGLDRLPGTAKLPTEADTRWRSRKEAWDKAKENYNNWLEAPSLPMANAIAICARIGGHYSIWCKVFENVPTVLTEIDNIYSTLGLYKKYEADGMTRTRRAKSQI